jgi:hypothetical protein
VLDENIPLNLGFARKWISRVPHLSNDFLRFPGRDNRNRALWIQFALRAIVPILGILLEFVGSRFAKWVNVGYFTFVVVVLFGMNFFVGSHFYIPRHFNRSWVFALAAAGVTYFLYSRWWVAQPTVPTRA